ncbi:MAG TPA: hypothetical protein VHL98_00205 [Microvirga sp.]|nr:hypothetical protein [Microvirga sp.]
MAISTSILVINIGMAETERSLVTLAGVLLFLLGIYGAWAWSRRRRARQARAAAES